MNASGERRVDLGRSHLLTGQLLDHGLSRLAGDAADVGHGLVAQAADAGLGLIHLGLKTGVFGLLAGGEFSGGLGLGFDGEAARASTGFVDLGLGGLGLRLGFSLNAAGLGHRVGDGRRAGVLDLAEPRNEDLGQQDVEDGEDEEEPDDLAAPMFEFELGQATSALAAAMGGDFRRAGRSVSPVIGGDGLVGCGLGGQQA